MKNHILSSIIPQFYNEYLKVNPDIFNLRHKSGSILNNDIRLLGFYLDPFITIQWYKIDNVLNSHYISIFLNDEPLEIDL